jgi:hypothetical protein
LHKFFAPGSQSLPEIDHAPTRPILIGGEKRIFMKVLLATVSISCALPLLPLSSHAQGAGGPGAGAAGGSVGGSAGAVGGTAVGGTSIESSSGAVSPSGNLAGSANSRVGTSLSTPAGVTPGASTVTPNGPINPGGISATPPGAVGRTFDRQTIGGAPAQTVVDPNRNQPVFRFPPSSTPAQDLVTNTPTLSGNTFPGGPVGVGNTVGTNFPARTTAPVREPVAVNLPPGARVVTNGFGVSEAIVPGPVIVPTNSVGRGPTFESASERTREVPQRSLPPRNPSIVRP